MSPLQVDIVAPDGEVFRGAAKRFRAPGVEGSFEVLSNHAPLLAAIDVGSIHVDTPAGEQIVFATSGGFVEVLNNEVIVLAETAEPAEQIDVERAEAAEHRAIERLEDEESPVDRVRAEEALERARNRLRVAMAEHGTGR
jgi:F-type H+-transporting ATPase subunit epsilon